LTRVFGSHLSIAGGMHNALLKAEELGCATLQVFTKNQKQWRCSPLGNGEVCEWQAHCKRLKFARTVSHDSYLINLASPDELLWRKSVELFIEEVSRCATLGIPYLVTHPGAHMGAGEAAGIDRIVAALNVVLDATPAAKRVTICLEGTAGQGSSIGHRLEHLAEIIERVRSPRRYGVCLDTAHLFAAGYDFRGRKYAALRRQIDKTIGLRRVKVLHLNDSKKELGSRVDRHEHIGCGLIGVEGFKPWVRDEAFAEVPKILETEKGKDEQGREWDAVNLEVLRGLL
jgi:deoxyribonuclease IV